MRAAKFSVSCEAIRACAPVLIAAEVPFGTLVVQTLFILEAGITLLEHGICVLREKSVWRRFTGEPMQWTQTTTGLSFAIPESE